MLGRHLRAHWSSIVVATGFALLLGAVSAIVFSLIGPALQILMTPDPTATIPMTDLFGPRLGGLVTRVTGEASFSAGSLWTTLPGLLVGLATVRAAISMAQWFLWERMSELISRDIRKELMDAYLGMHPMTRLVDKEDHEAALSSAFTTDVRLVREYIVHYFGGLPREGLQIVFYMITLVLLSPKLFVIFMIGVAPAAVFGSRLGKKLRKRAARALEDYSNLTEWLQQRLLGIETIKHYRTEDLERQKMYALTEKLYKRFLKASRVKARTSPMLEAVAIFAMVIVLYVSLELVTSGETTGGVQLSFFSTLAILGQSASKLGRYLNSSKEGAAALDRLERMMAFLKAHAASFVGIEPVAGGRGLIELEKVSVHYPGAADSALSGVDWIFEKGRIYCLCGPSGAGKSTLFNAMLGLIPLSGGKILIGPGHEATDLRLGYMPQSVKLAPDTIARNVCYPDAEADVGRVERALKSVGLWDFITSLPDGIESTVGPEGVGLSGGQAQRVQLARIDYHRPEFILVDEGTSALDPEVERLVYETLKSIAARGSTVVMIAHRLSALTIADDILLLVQGRLEAAGPRDDVTSRDVFKKFAGL